MSYVLAPSALFALLSVLSLPQPARADCLRYSGGFGEEECDDNGLTPLDSRLIMMGILLGLVFLFGGAALLIRRQKQKKALAAMAMMGNNGTGPEMGFTYTPAQLEAGAGAGLKYPAQAAYPFTGGPAYGYGAGNDARGGGGFGAPPSYPAPLYRAPEGPPPAFGGEKEMFRGVY
ncbi:hypothetical protein FIBSPDRAFT_865912 [Athelia psychrophila]|uniref:Uncharacterized protein n=1 Tax=Athelia psychrophila TaxID=1759441 RepID=A0A165Y5U6_9AGAM|nr:hypothetical protein FIBSPDRAFT_873845 [Fibularhizoctonia sp. CBS 109695]KZP16408.1 hypothetical protein FIBSPDRAFT_865912 [Fibularhizoctonia sp. CBS 109695]